MRVNTAHTSRSQLRLTCASKLYMFVHVRSLEIAYVLNPTFVQFGDLDNGSDVLKLNGQNVNNPTFFEQ